MVGYAKLPFVLEVVAEETEKMEGTSMDDYNFTYVFAFEKNLDREGYRSFFLNNWTDSVVYAVVYVFVVFGGKLYMRNRKRFELRPYLAMWSGCLALFSIVGAIRTLPELIWACSNGWEYSVCNSSFVSGRSVTNFWAVTFTLSKALELGDTVFIVLRKQNLIFLHWYHHITVLIYTWYSYAEEIAFGRWFYVANFIVHSFMYSYYTLRAMKYSVPVKVNMFITLLQLVQMIIGLAANIGAYVYLRSGRPCSASFTNLYCSMAMYFSYFVLFAQFFYSAYLAPKPASHVKQN